ncbi:MAG TPA: type IV pilus secretin PilQ [Desulfuromonadales bacterium]|nr:type IV pilus secretin PilQ [Desulfuromonadales bacterium]
MKWLTKTSILATVIFTVVSGLAVGSRSYAASEQIQDQKKLTAIESVSPSGNGSATELVIKLSSPTTYTSYKTASPLRLVVDFSQATQGTLSEPVIINKGNFKTVTASRFDTDAGVLTRLDIELVQDSEAVLSISPANPGEIKISFPSLSDTGTVAVEKTVSENVTPEKKLSAEKVDSATSIVADAPPAIPAVPASLPEKKTVSPVVPTVATDISRTLTAITAGKDAILLAVDGPVTDFKSFRLNNPERLVIDLADVKSTLSPRLIPLNVAGVASARIGLYPGKLRVVLDSVNGSFPDVTTAATSSGIVITLNAKVSAEVPPITTENPNTKLTATRSEPADSAAPAATQVSAPVENKVPEKVTAQDTLSPAKKAPVTGRRNQVATVEMLDFQVIDGVSRVSVKVAGDISVEQPLKTNGFVTLSIKNAQLPKKLQRSLETSSFVSPVLRVTPLAVKTRSGAMTKIRIALRAPVPFEFRQEGDMLFVDFKHPEGLSTDKLVLDTTEVKRPPVRQKKAATDGEETISSELSPSPESPAKLDTVRHYKGRKVTLEFADAEVRKIFQLLSEVSNKNFVLGDDVTGAISLKLVNVPWDQALDIILDTKGLDKREDGNIILIKGKGKFKTQAEEEQEIKKALTKAIELKTETFSVNYADIATISGQFNGLKTDRGTISLDTRTNKVIVKDIPQALDDMRKLLLQLDVAERQVMIEARIVEAQATFTRNLGVNWGVHLRDGSASFLGINSLDTGFGGLTSAAPTSGTGTSAGGNMGISFGTLSSNIQLDMRLNAAASAGMIKIISTPKVATLNHKAAKISQGQQIPYQNTTATTGAVTAFIAATLSLEVTPHINANGTIVMKIDAKNDTPGAGSPPPINTKQATTEMLLRDGETTVIGGIFVDSDTSSDDGVPYLMDIPLLGNLFKTNNKSKSKSELLIFITPRILGAI